VDAVIRGGNPRVAGRSLEIDRSPHVTSASVYNARHYDIYDSSKLKSASIWHTVSSDAQVSAQQIALIGCNDDCIYRTLPIGPMHVLKFSLVQSERSGFQSERNLR